ncbi:hypothetical protein E4T56_gene4555 [Termitomyces sp. T112]|nr:hypothetical protein E4T56_gene4555 [Termitomyces sp. T112]
MTTSKWTTSTIDPINISTWPTLCVIIHSPDRKGKGKATEEEEEMAIDPVDILLPADDNNNDDAEGKLEDYPDDGAGESSPVAD